MSFENNNSENRNSVRLNNTSTRRCSFCREPGHIISFCNNQRLQEFENLCIAQKAAFENDYKSFEQWLLGYYLEDSRIPNTYAIRKCGSTTRTSTQENIENIMEKFYGEFYDIPDLVTDDETDAEDDVDIENFSNIEYDLFQVMLLSRARRTFGMTATTLFIDQRKFDIASEIQTHNSEKQELICECNICYESHDITNFVKLNCNHEFCKECLKQTLRTCSYYQEPNCAYCRSQINLLTYRNENIKSEFDEFIN